MQWTHEKDLLLAERVIRATREGMPLRFVWVAIANEFKCEASVCEERWNKDLKKHYLTALDIAEKAYQITKMMQMNEPEEITKTAPIKSTVKSVKVKTKARPKKKKTRKATVEIDDMIAELRKWKKQKHEWEQFTDWKKERTSMEKEIEVLRREKVEMTEHIKELQKQCEEIKSDYSELMHIVSRATHMTDVG